MHLGLRTRSRTLLYFTRVHIRCVSQIYRTGIGPVTDSEKFLFIDNSIRGGISIASHRHTKANNPLVADYDHNSPHSYITYLDANNLYRGAMTEALPIGYFTFLAEDEVASFDLNATTKSDDYGYILEVDLKYPEHLHDSHSDYPLAAEKLRITNEMLSAYSSFLISKHVTSEKLTPNLYDKTNYVVHCENLRLYLKHGLQLVKVHRILKFRQSAWIKPYIDFNTAKRCAAKSSYLESHNKKSQ